MCKRRLLLWVPLPCAIFVSIPRSLQAAHLTLHDGDAGVSCAQVDADDLIGAEQPTSAAEGRSTAVNDSQYWRMLILV